MPCAFCGSDCACKVTAQKQLARRRGVNLSIGEETPISPAMSNRVTCRRAAPVSTRRRHASVDSAGERLPAYSPSERHGRFRCLMYHAPRLCCPGGTYPASYRQHDLRPSLHSCAFFARSCWRSRSRSCPRRAGERRLAGHQGRPLGLSHASITSRSSTASAATSRRSKRSSGSRTR